MNPKQTVTTALVSLAALSVSTAVLAESEAHQHGIAHLNLVQQGNALEIEFESPLANLVGFEHKPETAKQQQAYGVAVEAFESQTKFEFHGASCQLVEIEIELPFAVAEAEHHEEHEGHDHDEHKHHDEHEDHDHDEHKHHDKHEEHEHHEHQHHDEHSNLMAHYQYQCDGTVTSVSVQLFNLMPQLETIQAQWFSEQKQGSASLSRNAAELPLN
ncbi:DUF2796 domain-containing protein [Neiella marina]|uniref:DUF2796 domain-containing protein n=1 Tax=Neiella holothuriorum TaxID=2870530 RepID=A0ABS7EKL2_9GAMM|nr:DUF2796 domain-containing protein [Neiella holothuriorum]MBW8192898.1 DUF2796 domain-containing protein [Neiella holothuriorum]